MEESSIIAELEEEQESALMASARIADAIAVAENITIVEAFNIVQDAWLDSDMEPDALAIKLRHAAEITELINKLKRNGSFTSVAVVTALIRTRCGRPEWSVADTVKLDGAIYSGILRLADDEQKAERMQSSPPTEDELKKPPQDNEETPKRRGTKSSGT